MLRVLTDSTALQLVVFGAAIAAGMVISGDRIVGVLGSVLQRPGVRTWLGTDDVETDDSGEEGKGVVGEGTVSALDHG
jgi:hypothetical protein